MECVFKPGQLLFCLTLNLLLSKADKQMFDLLYMVGLCWGMVAAMKALLAW